MMKIELTTPIEYFCKTKLISSYTLEMLKQKSFLIVADLVMEQDILEEMQEKNLISFPVYKKLQMICHKLKPSILTEDDTVLLNNITSEAYQHILENSRCQELFQHYFPTVIQLREAIESGVPFCLQKIDIRNRRLNSEIRHLVYDFASMVVESSTTQPGRLPQSHRIYADFISVFRLHVDTYSYQEVYDLFLSIELRNRLEYWYNDYFVHYLTEADSINIKKLFPTFADFLPYVDNLTSLLDKLHDSFQDQYKETCLKLQNDMQELMNKRITYNEETAQYGEASQYFPFLDSQQRCFVDKFKEKYGHFPYFYLAVHHLKKAAVFNTNMVDLPIDFTVEIMYKKKMRYPFRYFSEDEFSAVKSYIPLFETSPLNIPEVSLQKIIEKECIGITHRTFCFLLSVMNGTDLFGKELK